MATDTMPAWKMRLVDELDRPQDLLIKYAYVQGMDESGSIKSGPVQTIGRVFPCLRKAMEGYRDNVPDKGRLYYVHFVSMDGARVHTI